MQFAREKKHRLSLCLMMFISPNVLKTRFGRATIKLKVKEKGRILTFEESILLGENR